MLLPKPCCGVQTRLTAHTSPWRSMLSQMLFHSWEHEIRQRSNFSRER